MDLLTPGSIMSIMAATLRLLIVRIWHKYGNAQQVVQHKLIHHIDYRFVMGLGVWRQCDFHGLEHIVLLWLLSLSLSSSSSPWSSLIMCVLRNNIVFWWALVHFHYHHRGSVLTYYQFPNFDGVIVGVWKWIRNFIIHFLGIYNSWLYNNDDITITDQTTA